MSVTTIIMSFIVIAAALFPRQLPCDDHPAAITKVLTTSASNKSLPVLCFANHSTVRGFEELKIEGSCMDLSEMLSSSVFISGVSSAPIWKWGGVEIPNATIFRHKCEDINLYQRAHVYICSYVTILIPHQPSTLRKIEGELLSLFNPIPCQNQRFTYLVPVIFEDKLVLSIDSITPTGFCVNQTGGTNVTIFGNDFLYLQMLNNKGGVISTVIPTLTWNNQDLSASIVTSSCTEFSAVKFAATRIYTCTQMTALFPQVIGTLTSDDLTVVNAEPCTGNVFTISAVTGGNFC
jgi:hypothetical protein